MANQITRSELQQIADIPGYGNAAKALDKGGYWDRAKDPAMQKYTVVFEITGSIVGYHEMTVWAADQDEAHDLASGHYDEAKRSVVWEKSTIEADDVEVFEITCENVDVYADDDESD